MRRSRAPARSRKAPAARRSPATFQARVVDIGSELSHALSGVLDALPGGPHRPQRLARALGVNTVLTSRLLKAARHHDPLAVAHLMPGPEPLRRLLLAAERSHIDRAITERASEAIDRFQDLIDIEAGDRSALDAIISGWLPDAREKVELIAKQSVFRGASQLLGCTCDVEYSAFIVHPSGESRDHADVVSLLVTQGLRRVRPGAVIKCDTVHAGTPMLALDGCGVQSGRELLLEGFCSRPLPELNVERLRVDDCDVVRCSFEGDSIGLRSAVNLAIALFLPHRKSLHASRGETQAHFAVGVAMPCRAMVFDMLLHKDVYPRAQPSLNLYRTVGVMGAHNSRRHERADREGDRLDVVESMQLVGTGMASSRIDDLPRSGELIRHVCDRRGWHAEALRVYRCRIEYPMYGSEVVASFDLADEADA